MKISFATPDALRSLPSVSDFTFLRVFRNAATHGQAGLFRFPGADVDAGGVEPGTDRPRRLRLRHQVEEGGALAAQVAACACNARGGRTLRRTDISAAAGDFGDSLQAARLKHGLHVC
jgi:hypothetical protein